MNVNSPVHIEKNRYRFYFPVSVATLPPGMKTVYEGGGLYLVGGGRDTNALPPTITEGEGEASNFLLPFLVFFIAFLARLSDIFLASTAGAALYIAATTQIQQYIFIVKGSYANIITRAREP